MNWSCQSKVSIRENSFFSHGHLSIAVIMKIICCFAQDMPITSCSRLLNIRLGTIVDYYDNLRGEYMDYLSDHPIIFRDNGEYEVDEVLIKHVYNQRIEEYQQVWIGGILERATGKLILYRVNDRSRASLIAPIRRHVPIGSFIYTDEWSSYRALDNLQYNHFTVNHSAREYARTENFGGDVLNVHINTLEGINRTIRQRLANKSRRNIIRLDLVLAEMMYRNSGRNLFYPFMM